MKYFFAFLLISFQALAQVPPDPPMPTNTVPVKLRSPKHAEHLASLGAKMVKPVSVSTVTVAVATPLQMLTLVWNYPADQVANVVFEVWACTDLTAASSSVLMTYDAVPVGFSLLMTTTQTNAVIQSNLPAQFFIVRARDTATGAYSNWNQASVTGPTPTVVLLAPMNNQTVSGTITLEARAVRLNSPWDLMVAAK